MGLAYTFDGRPPVNRAAGPEQEDRTAEMVQEGSEELCDVDSLKVLRLPVEVQAHMLPLRRHGQGRQGGESSMFVAVWDDWRLSGGSPGAAPGGDEQKAALIQEDQMGAQALDFFLSLAMCSASSERWPLRRAEGPDAPAPDSSSPNGARASRHALGDSAPHSGPE
jgi:hypothetical protein